MLFSGRFQRIEARANLIQHRGVRDEVLVVLVHDEHLAVVVVFDPVVVLVVEPLEVQLVDVHLVFAAPLADLRGERRHARLEVDQQVGLGNERREGCSRRCTRPRRSCGPG